MLFPVVVGMMLPNKKDFKVFDDGIPTLLLSFMWPFVLVVCAIGTIVFVMAALVGLIWTFLLTLGSSFGRKLEIPPKKEEALSDQSDDV